MKSASITNREFHVTTKAVYIAALKIESVAKRFGVDPAYWLAERRLEIALRRRDPDRIAFANEVCVLMKCREFFSRDALYLLTD